VVGSGPAGLSFASIAAMRGHAVSVFEQQERLGGQMNMANQIPGKEEFNETIRYFRKQLELHGVQVRLNAKATAADLLAAGYEAVVLASGVIPRRPDIAGIDHPRVLSYVDVLLHKKAVGDRVAIVGAGGIGFDVAVYLTAPAGAAGGSDRETFLQEWGVDPSYQFPGGLAPNRRPPAASGRQVYLLQRKPSKMGASLGKTTGWIHRAALKQRNVAMLNGVAYEKIDDDGLHIHFRGARKLLAVDTVVICAGQEPLRDLKASLESGGMTVYLIGGADRAVELDAQRAIDQGMRLGGKI
jgi:2,4-dienoyl-CoA reductase (NADPH2)